MRAYHDYHLYTAEHGKITGTSYTNDNRDWGEPNEEATWGVSYPSRESMLKSTGGSHIGVSGIKVSVYLDGDLIDHDGQVMSAYKWDFQTTDYDERDV